MKNYSLKFFIYYLIIAVNLFIGLTAIYRLSGKADLPFQYYSLNDKLISGEQFQNIQSGNVISSIDGDHITSEFEAEFILDTKHIGDEVMLVINDRNGFKENLTVRLSEFYKTNTFIFLSLITGFIFWLTGAYVFILRKEERSVRILCLILITFSVAILTTPCHFGRGDDWIGYIIRNAHSISYIAGSIFFLQFTLIFPNDFFKNQKSIISLIYIISFIISAIVSTVLFIAMRDLNEKSIDDFVKLWSFIQFILLGSILSGTIILLIKYKKLSSKSEKLKLEWLFWGITAGAGPFVIFWLVPGIFGIPYLVDENILLLFLILIPVSFTIAVIKYHIFDIEIVIKRSVIYFSLISLTILLYLMIIYGLSIFANKFTGNDSGMLNLIAALFIALIFNPLRLKLNKFVDSVFFREKYFFDKAITAVTDKLKKCNTIENLGEILLEEISLYIPVKSMAICIVNESGDRLRILKQKNYEKLTENVSAFKLRKLLPEFDLPFAVKEKIEKGIVYNSNQENVFKRWNINVAIPVTLVSTELIGVIIMGDKMSELRYSVSDIELLNTIASEAALAIKRLQLHKRLILEEAENFQLKEINELKSYFVSSVSHDLKTPISAIKIFTELLKNENISKEKLSEYLGMIEGETDRLGRMIENILNYNKMEKGIINYTFKKLDLNKILKSVLDNMNYDFIMHKFSVEKQFSGNPVFISGDPDALNSLFENLFSNSIKYSGQNKYLKIVTSENEKCAEVIVEDRGIGISENNHEHIFDPYFREKGLGNINIKGTGLGLTIVKNITDAHSGKIEVKSKIGCGSIFKINFPVYKNE